MIRRGDGSIINLVDLSAWNPWPNRGAHSVAKAALLALTRQLAVELAPTVRANAIALGPTIPATRFTQEQIEHLAQRTLKGTWGEAKQVAAAVRFLVESDFVTGECLTIDGGERWAHVRSRFLAAEGGIDAAKPSDSTRLPHQTGS
jgi:NAD(P)-dependent dehydrogenase (short-subunit alcohol dehydrogenase family)